MSWGTPAVGSAPYQQPAYAHGAPGYNPQHAQNYPSPSGYPYANGSTYTASMQPQRQPEHRPPKKKGNPVITRYPPPPGYRGPAQPQGPYGQHQYPNQYQPSQSTYPAGHPPPTHYPPQGYPPASHQPPAQGYHPPTYAPPQPQPGYSQQPYATAQPCQHPQTGYPAVQGYAPPSSYPEAQPYAAQQSGYQAYPPQAAPSDPHQQIYPQPQGWQNPVIQAPYPSVPYNPSGATAQDPSATQVPNTTPAPPAQDQSSVGDPKSAVSADGKRPHLNLSVDDWDFEFDGAIWPKSNEPVDKNLSLGVIHWYPPRQVTRALPATFEEAEKQSLEAPAPKFGNGESVSIYFTLENSHEAFLDVRQTDDWPKVKDDPAFVVFPPPDKMDLIPLQECIDRRHRPDEPLEEAMEAEGEVEETQDSNWNVMDNLEQALSEETADRKSPKPGEVEEAGLDQKQEDILAKLGVTGAPKPASKEPIYLPFPQPEKKPPGSLPGRPPASLPEKPLAPPASPPHSGLDHYSQRANSYATSHNPNYESPPPARPYGSMSATAHARPAPPAIKPDDNSQSKTNGHSAMGSHAFDGSRDSPARSDASNHSMVDSDNAGHHVNGMDRTRDSAVTPTTNTVPQLERSDSSFSRKRSYDNIDATEDQLRQQDDDAKRKRRSLIADAYGRR